MQDFEDTFATVAPPPDDSRLVIMIDHLGLGFTAAAAPYFDGGELSCGGSRLASLRVIFRMMKPTNDNTPQFWGTPSSGYSRRGMGRHHQIYHLCQHFVWCRNRWRCTFRRFAVSDNPQVFFGARTGRCVTRICCEFPHTQ